MKIFTIFASVVLIISIYFIKEQFSSHSPQSENFLSRKAFDFTLGTGDEKISLSDFKGRTIVLYFGFTYCPDVCPTSISFISKVFEKINDPSLDFIFVSVDHKRDTQKTVSEYVKYYNNTFIGVTGTKKQIDEITKSFNIFYRFINLPTSHMKYTVDHTSRFIVIDKNQNWVDSIHSESSLEDAVSRITKHI